MHEGADRLKSQTEGERLTGKKIIIFMQFYFYF